MVHRIAAVDLSFMGLTSQRKRSKRWGHIHVPRSAAGEATTTFGRPAGSNRRVNSYNLMPFLPSDFMEFIFWARILLFKAPRMSRLQHIC
jgi:hypothetical protein